jgi:hypothetical protein
MMFSRRGLVLAGTIVLFSFGSPGQLPLVREEQSVKVDGTEEVWRLKWKSAPKPFCDDETQPPTCPCNGFAPGQRGDLDLVRLRRGIEIDRLNLTKFFRESGVWSGAKDEAAVHRVARVIHLGDYNHDGLATEFFLQSDALPCGKRYGVVVGITRDNPRLHAFGTVRHPDVPLFMRVDEGEKLRTATGPVNTVDWNCGDHGSDERVEFEIRWSPKGIEGVRRTYACLAGRPGGLRGKLLSEAPL